MIESRGLTSALRGLVRRLEADIKEHSEAKPELDTWLRDEFGRAREGGRTGQAFEAWREEQVTLSAVGWGLSCVFVRFCEDTGLIAEPRLAGAGERLEAAADTTRHHFQQNPGDSDREYLLWVFDQAGRLPGMSGLMDGRESRMRELPLSVDGATRLLQFWRQTDPETGELNFDFTDPERDTRFLGDLYQDLSEAARKRYALLQTPIFIEEFILDRTLEPAIGDFGLADTSLIDPACGSGHFLLGAFRRLLERWTEREPQTNVRVLCQRVFDQIAGVDINPYAAAIAHFRLLVAALNACEIRALREAPDFRIEVATGDALLHGHPPGQLPNATGAWARPEHQHFYEAEDRERVTRILDRRYAAVVANPPYIVPPDPVLRQAYRDRYSTCHRKYGLTVPFTERLFDLAAPSEGDRPCGFVGMITSNSFMTREYGKKLIEDYLPRVDIEMIVDTSGVRIPGHGTPTVIVFGRPRLPVTSTVRGMLGIRGEGSGGTDPAEGVIWKEILAFAGESEVEGSYISVEPISRQTLAQHPWSLKGGGAGEVHKLLVRASERVLADAIASSGFAGISGMDQVALLTPAAPAARLLDRDVFLPATSGDDVRDWRAFSKELAYFPYDGERLRRLDEMPRTARFLWPYRSTLEARATFSKLTYRQEGRPWWEWHQVSHSRVARPLKIVFSEIATHNNFVLDHGGRVFTQTAPVIELPPGSSKQAHLELLGPLNSSACCFWMKQVFYPKGGEAGWSERYQQDSTKLVRLPLPPGTTLEVSTRLDRVAADAAAAAPQRVLESGTLTRRTLSDARQLWLGRRGQLIALQEELDWQCYRLYDLLDEELTHPLDQVPDVELGERAFEIALARRLASGEVETEWFERHGSTPVTEIPGRWPEEYRALVQKRIDAIEAVKAIRLIEQPEYKRRWTTLKLSEWEAMESGALRNWLLDRLESEAVWSGTQLRTAGEVADRMLGDREFQVALELFAGEDADPSRVVADLLAEECVPYLAALRYKAAGMEKRAVWERTWQLQRDEDSGKFVGEIDVPPKYKQSDFRSSISWRHRGKLDVPKERFTSYPDAAADGATLYGWAGWDHAQRAQGLAQRIVAARETEGMEAERLLPLLAGLLELLPWLRQWHSETDPEYGMPLSDFYDTFLDERARALGCTRDELAAWRPPEAQRRRRKVAA